MVIYFFLYFLVFALSWASRHIYVVGSFEQRWAMTVEEKERRANKGYIICIFVGLILIVGLRHESMGTDLASYLPSFDMLNSYSLLEVFFLPPYLNYEKGYVILNKLVGTVCGGNRSFFLLFCAIVSYIPVGRLIYKYSNNLVLSIVIYLGLPVFLVPYSALRQGIAIGITLCAFDAILENRGKKFFLLVLFASTFHSSAIVFLLAWPVYHIRIKKDIAIFSFFLLPIIYILRYPLFSFFSGFFSATAQADDNGAVTLFLVFSAVYLFCVVFSEQDKKYTNGLSNLFFLACAIQAMGGVYSIVIRVGYYFMIYIILLLPEVLEDMSHRDGYMPIIFVKIIVYFCFISFGLYSIYTSRNSWAQASPYIFFWQ